MDRGVVVLVWKLEKEEDTLLVIHRRSVLGVTSGRIEDLEEAHVECGTGIFARECFPLFVTRMGTQMADYMTCIRRDIR